MKPTGIAALVLAWASAPAAFALPSYPSVVQQELTLTQAPSCTLCHLSSSGGGAAVKPVAVSLKARGLTAENDSTLRSALAKLKSDATDSDFDGTSDVDELQAGTDPNMPRPPCDPMQDSSCPKPAPKPCTSDDDCNVEFERCAEVPPPECAMPPCDPAHMTCEPPPDGCEGITIQACVPKFMAPCTSSEQCGEGFVCDTTEHRCKLDLSNPCSDNEDCPAEDVCLHKRDASRCTSEPNRPDSCPRDDSPEEEEVGVCVPRELAERMRNAPGMDGNARQKSDGRMEDKDTGEDESSSDDDEDKKATFSFSCAAAPSSSDLVGIAAVALLLARRRRRQV